MMEGQQVDLDALIKTERHNKKIQKEKNYRHRHNDRRQHSHKNQYKNKYYYEWDDREGENQNQHVDKYQKRQKYHQEDHHREKRTKNKQSLIQSYAIFATGFVPDVSIEDILNLAKGKQILSLKTTLKGTNGNIIDPKIDRKMQVLIDFLKKQEADQFIKQYTDKKLDGKNVLQFQFRRGFKFNKQLIQPEGQKPLTKAEMGVQIPYK